MDARAGRLGNVFVRGDDEIESARSFRPAHPLARQKPLLLIWIVQCLNWVSIKNVDFLTWRLALGVLTLWSFRFLYLRARKYYPGT